MTFDLTAEHTATQDAARRFARERIQPVTAAIDAQGAMPGDLVRDAAALISGVPTVSLVVAVTELAAASGAVALAAAAPNGRVQSEARWTGLRGAPAPDGTPSSQLAVTAVTLGVARAALEVALDELRTQTKDPHASAETPHWVVADVATSLEAARLVTLQAAMRSPLVEGEIATARLLAAAAAREAVGAAIRLVGERGLRPGGTLDRLARDVNTLSVLAGTEETLRATAARAILESSD